MVQLEQEIVTRIRPFEQKNRAAAQKHLQLLDDTAFKKIRE